MRRAAPTLVAAALAGAYVVISPPSADLAAQLFRAQLFRTQGFGLFDTLWYSGHDVLGYSVLFPAISAALTPQLAAALAAVATAATFEPLARRHWGERATTGAVLFGAATAIDLYTGRLNFAFGALPALAALAALDAGSVVAACMLAVVAALCSPVAALFAAVAAAGYVVCGRWGGLAVAGAALGPVGAMALAFPEGGYEPFAFSALWPVVLLCAVGFVTVRREAAALRAGIAIYGAVTVAAYAVATPVGSNAARLGTALAAPLAALEWRGRRWALGAVLAPLLYVGWQAAVRDTWSASRDPAADPGYYQPLLRFLGRQGGPPFRIEIPFTASHWEADVVARRFPIARGWERQLDIADNPRFYSGRLTASAYGAWLHADAIRFVALPDAALDYSARAEAALIGRGLPYLRLVMRSAHWRVYSVADPTPIAGGALVLRGLGSDWIALDARSAATSVLRVHYTPYWALAEGIGCVAPAGPWTRVTVRRPGPVRLVIRFALERIGTSSPRCS